MPRRGASLRGALAPFLAKANVFTGLSLSSGATRQLLPTYTVLSVLFLGPATFTLRPEREARHLT
jgi:hypothetical protein